MSMQSYQQLAGIKSGGCGCRSGTVNPLPTVSQGMLQLRTQPSVGNMLSAPRAHCGNGSGCGVRRQQVVPVFGAFSHSLSIPNVDGGDYFNFFRAYGNCSQPQHGMVQPTGCWSQ